jgi:hypothetical protein
MEGAIAPSTKTKTKIMNISKILLRTLIQMEMEQIKMLKIEMKEHPITAKYDQISIHKCEGRIEAFNTILNLKKS